MEPLLTTTAIQRGIVGNRTANNIQWTGCRTADGSGCRPVHTGPSLRVLPTTAVSSCATLATTRVERWPLERVAGLVDCLPGWAPTITDELSAATTARAALVAVLRLLSLAVAAASGGGGAAAGGAGADAPPRRAGPRRAAAMAAAAAIKAELQGIVPK